MEASTNKVAKVTMACDEITSAVREASSPDITEARLAIPMLVGRAREST